MDFEFEKKWRDLLVEVSKEMDEPLDMQSLIFMIGVQELNQGYVKLSKNQSTNGTSWCPRWPKIGTYNK